MSCPDGYQRTNASRYRASNVRQHQPPTRCSCTGVVVALIVIGILIAIPSILGGGIVFIIGDPFLFFISYVTLYGPIVVCVLIIWFAWNRRGESIPEDI
ncbi:MAG: hypothetical protein ACTSUZ_15400 [Candidatus Thorarchaeota archaeon]